jgi:predicted nucleic acid-binding protein
MSIVLDTCVIIARKPELASTKYFFSVVVIEELIAGASDASEAKMWIALGRQAQRVGRLLVPDMEDWIESGRVLNSLLRGLKSKHRGRTPKLSHLEKQRITRDVLIARTARRAGADLVTDNIKDFAMIQRFCNVRLMGSQEFFG